jgi:LPXTG-motif cell wall-anchored protein
MQRIAGLGLVVLGVILGIYGMNASDSLSSSFSRMFTGSPTDRTIWFFIGGIVCLAAGVALIFARRRAHS